MTHPMRAEPAPTPAPVETAARRWTLAEGAYVLLRAGGVGNGGTVPLASRLGVAGGLELIGGLLLVVGLFTRPVALVLAGQMVVAYVVAHLPRGLVPLQNGGELALLYALIFVFLAAVPRARD